jgi:hypothetical protein
MPSSASPASRWKRRIESRSVGVHLHGHLTGLLLGVLGPDREDRGLRRGTDVPVPLEVVPALEPLHAVRVQGVQVQPPR